MSTVFSFENARENGIVYGRCTALVYILSLASKLGCLRVCKGNSFDLPKARKTAAMNSAREVSMPRRSEGVCKVQAMK